MKTNRMGKKLTAVLLSALVLLSLMPSGLASDAIIVPVQTETRPIIVPVEKKDSAKTEGDSKTVTPVEQIVTSSGLSISLTTANTAVVVDNEITLVARLNGQTAGMQPTGKILFKAGSTVLGSRSLSNGRATITWKPEEVGQVSITAYYQAGTGETFSVRAGSLTMTVVAPLLGTEPKTEEAADDSNETEQQTAPSGNVVLIDLQPKAPESTTPEVVTPEAPIVDIDENDNSTNNNDNGNNGNSGEGTPGTTPEETVPVDPTNPITVSVHAEPILTIDNSSIFSATVKGANGAPVKYGSVTFYAGEAQLETVPLFEDGEGKATIAWTPRDNDQLGNMQVKAVFAPIAGSTLEGASGTTDVLVIAGLGVVETPAKTEGVNGEDLGEGVNGADALGFAAAFMNEFAPLAATEPTVTATITPASPIYATMATVEVTVSGTGSVPKGTVVWGNMTGDPHTLVDGKATFTVPIIDSTGLQRTTRITFTPDTGTEYLTAYVDKTYTVVPADTSLRLEYVKDVGGLYFKAIANNIHGSVSSADAPTGTIKVSRVDTGGSVVYLTTITLALSDNGTKEFGPISGLANGNTVLLEYSGDTLHNPSNTQMVVVTYTPTISLSAVPSSTSDFGDEITFTAEIFDGNDLAKTINVKFTDVFDSESTVTSGDPDASTHKVTATYKYTPSRPVDGKYSMIAEFTARDGITYYSSPVVVTINKAKPTLSVVVNDGKHIKFGQSLGVNVTVAGVNNIHPTGTVSAAGVPGTLSNGKATVNLLPLNIPKSDAYTITATYTKAATENNYDDTGVTGAGELFIDKADTSTSLAITGNSTTGFAFAVTVRALGVEIDEAVLEDVAGAWISKGTVTIYDSNNTPIGTIEDWASTSSPKTGTASGTFASAVPGVSYYAQYNGSSYYNTSKSTPNIAINKETTTTTLTSDKTAYVYGDAVTLTATMTQVGKYQLTGKMQFFANGTKIAEVDVNSSTRVAAYTYTPTGPATINYTAQYVGDTYNAASSSAALSRVIDRAVPPLTVAAVANANGTYTLTITMVLPGSSLAAPTGTVNVNLTSGTGTISPTTVTLVNGVGTATLSNASTLASITATFAYSGDTNYHPLSKSEQVTLGKPGPTIVLKGTVGSNGRGLTLLATVAGPTGAKVPTGKVTFVDEAGKTIAEVTVNDKGEATYKWSKAPKGSYKVYAKYGGDTLYGAVETYIHVTVPKNPSSGTSTGTTTSSGKMVRLLDNNATMLEQYDTSTLQVNNGYMDITSQRDRTQYTFEIPFSRMAELAAQSRSGYFRIKTPVYTLQVPFALMGNMPGFADFLSQNKLDAGSLYFRVTTELVESSALSDSFNAENESSLASGFWRVTMSIYDASGRKQNFTVENLNSALLFAPTTSGQATGAVLYNESSRAFETVNVQSGAAEVKSDGIYALTGQDNG